MKIAVVVKPNCPLPKAQNLRYNTGFSHNRSKALGLSDRQQAYLQTMGIAMYQTQSARRSGATVARAEPDGEDPLAGLNWDQLNERVMACVDCDLHATRTQAVFGVGNREADLLIIGEAPGAEEDRQGEPFVGRAGQLLNEMLKSIGFARQKVYIANILKCRPPNNRDPKPEEAECCVGYLYRQIELLQPKLILAVGRIAAQRLLKTDQTLGRLRTKIHTLPQTQTPFVVTYHPAYLLRSPKDKRKAWDDLLLAKRTLDSITI